MSKFSAKIFEAFTGATAFATILASRTFATEEANSIQSSSLQKGVDAMHAEGMPTQLVGVDGSFSNVINTILYVAGIVAVAMLIIGGIRFMISRGDKDKVQKAKNTILYACIGLIICALAFAIVNWVIKSVIG